ncbi:DnaJ domain-containing protein [bacterium]|nr:DnaJ domain-containing protein [bacterium]
MRREWLEKDYYAILGVERTATQKEIRRAYRALARKHHPDTNPHDTDSDTRFKEVSEAYATLSDLDERREYDEARDSVGRHAYAGGPGGAQYVRMEDLGDLGDLLGSDGGMFGGLSDLFGGARGGTRGPRKGADLDAEVSLTFHEAIAGATRRLSVPGPSGGKDVTVKIPAGITDGARVRVRGKGSAGVSGGSPGDLYVTVRAGSHPVFGRKGTRHLEVTVPITFTEAALGASVTVPTLDGQVTLKVPAGTRPGTTLRASGKGIEAGSKVGDLLVKLEVEVPAELTDEQRDLLGRLRETEADHNPRSHLGV